MMNAQDRYGRILLGKESWLFERNVSMVLAAAQEKERWHESRLAHWRAELNTRDQRLRTDGIIVEDPSQPVALASQYAASSISPNTPRLQVDHAMQQAVAEAQRKIAEHSDKRDTYTRWVRLLEAEDGARSLALTFEDAEFFNL